MIWDLEPHVVSVHWCSQTSQFLAPRQTDLLMALPAMVCCDIPREANVSRWWLSKQQWMCHTLIIQICNDSCDRVVVIRLYVRVNKLLPKYRNYTTTSWHWLIRRQCKLWICSCKWEWTISLSVFLPWGMWIGWMLQLEDWQVMSMSRSPFVVLGASNLAGLGGEHICSMSWSGSCCTLQYFSSLWPQADRQKHPSRLFLNQIRSI